MRSKINKKLKCHERIGAEALTFQKRGTFSQRCPFLQKKIVLNSAFKKEAHDFTKGFFHKHLPIRTFMEKALITMEERKL